MKEETLRKKLLYFIEGASPAQLIIFNDTIQELYKKKGFKAVDALLAPIGRGNAGHDKEDLEEGNSGTLYRSPD